MENNIDDIAKNIYQEEKVQDFLEKELFPLFVKHNFSDFDIALMAESLLKACYNFFAESIKPNDMESMLKVGVFSSYFFGVLNNYYNFTYKIDDSNKLALLTILDMEYTEYEKRIKFIKKLRDEIHG